MKYLRRANEKRAHEKKIEFSTHAHTSVSDRVE